MWQCAFNFFRLPGVQFHVAKVTKWILNRFCPWAGESLRLALLGKLHTVTYAVLVEREPGGVLV